MTGEIKIEKAPRQTMGRWVEAVADWLKPIYRQMREELAKVGH